MWQTAFSFRYVCGAVNCVVSSSAVVILFCRSRVIPSVESGCRPIHRIHCRWLLTRCLTRLRAARYCINFIALCLTDSACTFLLCVLMCLSVTKDLSSCWVDFNIAYTHVCCMSCHQKIVFFDHLMGKDKQQKIWIFGLFCYR